MRKVTAPIYFLATFFLIGLFTPLAVSASWSKNQNSPLLTLGTPGSWDDNFVAAPSILSNDGIIKMWYEGQDGFNFRIGYATSSTGISWTKYPNFVIDIVPADGEFNVHDPKVLFKDNLFHMWYAASNNQINDIHINYSQSANGINWRTPIKRVVTGSFSWDMDISFPYTLFIGNEYKMWYAARGSYNGKFRWRLGYASSHDGISWTKYPIPILEATENWEGKDLGNPSVLYVNGIYYMWYHGDFSIGRATSKDGIKWEKDFNNPLLTPNSETFDSNRVAGPFVINLFGTYYMYYTGVANDNKWRIGLATSDSIGDIPSTPTPTILTPTDSPTITPTTTPTSSPTPTTPTVSLTPTPNPSLTPTPTLPEVFSPIILIPGLGASWNSQAISSCSLDSKDNWKMSPFVYVYKRLINTLIKNAGLILNDNFYIYNYDWRLPLSQQADNFKAYLSEISSNKPSNTKYRLIGHSLGGLVIRSYLDKYNNDAKVEQVITVGTPHQGTVLAYPLWEKGEVWTKDLLSKIAFNQILTHCRIIKSFLYPNIDIPILKLRSKREIVQQLIPSIHSILPTFDYLTEFGHIKPTSSLFYQNDWLTMHPLPKNNYNTDFVTISGDNNETLLQMSTNTPSKDDLKKGDWIDGKPDEKIYSRQGDGTILHKSSQLDGIKNETIDGNHLSIISSKVGVLKILQLLNYDKIKPAVEDIPDEVFDQALIISVDQPVSMQLIKPKYNKFETTENILVDTNPYTGLYRLTIFPKIDGKANLYISFYRNDSDYIQENIIINLRKKISTSYLINIKTNNTKPLTIISLN